MREITIQIELILERVCCRRAIRPIWFWTDLARPAGRTWRIGRADAFQNIESRQANVRSGCRL
jgi:hypothetical protein